MYILNGNGTFCFQNRSFNAKKGDIVLHHPHEAYKLISQGTEPWSFCVISFFSDTLPFSPGIVKIPERGQMLKERFIQADKVWTYKNAGYKLQLKSILFSIFYGLINFDESLLYGDSIDKAVKFIKNNYSKRLTVSELAQIAGYSQSYFNSEFVRLVGKSPIRYLNEIRIERAKELLRTKLFSINEIAEDCGFENVYYFSNVFKKYTGISPSKF